MLGDAIRHRREALGLSMRAAAQRIGISAGYLVELEHGRNPTTGRPPVPSATVLAGIGRTLDIDTVTLLELAGAMPRPSTHVLLVQTGGRRSTRAAAKQSVTVPVDAWIEIAGRGDATRALGVAADAASVAPDRVLGLVFGGGSTLLRTPDRRDAILASETTWEDDVAAACRAAGGTAPAANVCAYRTADLRASGDPLATVIELVRAHPHVAAQDGDGRVTTGPTAIEALLAAVRPGGVTAATWASIASAAAVGLHRETGAA
jgi:transcriptional regulator with XRE-family HTH domain